MAEILIFLLIFIFSLFVLIKCISYGIYEIKIEKNKTGGISVIVLTIISMISTVLIFVFD